jgi:hypothetical protein
VTNAPLTCCGETRIAPLARAGAGGTCPAVHTLKAPRCLCCCSPFRSTRGCQNRYLRPCCHVGAGERRAEQRQEAVEEAVVLNEIARHHRIGHGSSEQLLDEAMPTASDQPGSLAARRVSVKRSDIMFNPSPDRLDVNEFGHPAPLSCGNRWQHRNPPPALQEAESRSSPSRGGAGCRQSVLRQLARLFPAAWRENAPQWRAPLGSLDHPR